jgi:hypothetical protein
MGMMGLLHFAIIGTQGGSVPLGGEGASVLNMGTRGLLPYRSGNAGLADRDRSDKIGH